MGRFDKVLEGEKKLKGVKRKVYSLLSCQAPVANLTSQVEPTEAPAEQERAVNLALIQRMEKEPPKKKVKKDTADDVLNVRKAIRATSQGRGSVALARSYRGGKTRGKPRR